MFLASPNIAMEVVYRAIDEELRTKQIASFRVDEFRVEKYMGMEDRWIYIPPKVMEQIAESIVKRVEEAFKDKYEIRKRLEEGKYTIMITPTTPPTPEGPKPSPPTPPPPPPPPTPPNPWEVFKSLVNSIAEKGGGMVWVKMEVKDRGSADRIIKMLSPIKDYIKESREEGVAG
jgi:hypothetical protein